MKNKSLKDLRLKKGFTQGQVAKLTNKTIIFISMLENGKRNASDDMKQKLAKIYECDISDIFLALKSTKCLKTNKKEEV